MTLTQSMFMQFMQFMPGRECFVKTPEQNVTNGLLADTKSQKDGGVERVAI